MLNAVSASPLLAYPIDSPDEARCWYDFFEHALIIHRVLVVNYPST